MLNTKSLPCKHSHRIVDPPLEVLAEVDFEHAYYGQGIPEKEIANVQSKYNTNGNNNT